MYYKLVSIADDEFLYNDEYGDYNDMPPNMEEINEEEFYSQTLTYFPRWMGYRQVMSHPDYSYISLTMYLYGGGEGVGIGRTDKGMKFFKFASCIHDWETTYVANCYREFKCKKCGATNAIDSSD